MHDLKNTEVMYIYIYIFKMQKKKKKITKSKILMTHKMCDDIKVFQNRFNIMDYCVKSLLILSI